MESFRGKAGQTHKPCPGCEQMLELDQFWLCSGHWDGLQTYCIACFKQRKRIAMERKREAREQIALAGLSAIEAAQQWDQGVKLLCTAWRKFLEIDTAVRLNKRDAGAAEVDACLDARLLHQRAAFSLNLALSDANFPMPFSVMRECGFQDSLVAYIGTSPESAYLGNAEPAEIEPQEVTEPVAQPAAQQRRRGRKPAQAVA